MNIIFADKNLKKYANNDRLALQKLGKRRASLYKQRLDDIQAADSFEDLRNLPGNYHEL